MTGPIAIDPLQIGRFVTALFTHATDGGIVSLRAFHDDGKRDTGAVKIRTVHLNGEGLGPVVEAATKLATEAAEADRPVVLALPIATFTSASASERHLQEGLALTVELDQRAEAALVALRIVIGSPTLVVASGGSWADPATGEVQPKLHLHWRLSEPTQTIEEHQRLKRARALACDLVGADATSIAIVHPLRLAGSLHRKVPGQAKLVTIVEENPDSEIDLDDVLSELEGLAILRGEAGPSAPVPMPAADPTVDGELLLQCATRIANPDLEWAAWNRLGMAFWRASNGDEMGFQAFTTWSGKSSKHDADATRARWAHYRTSPPDRIGVGTLVHEARKADPEFRRRRAGPDPELDDDGSQDSLALTMGQEWGDARYVALWGAWLFWTGSRWQRDECLLHVTRTRQYLRQRAGEQRNDAAKKLRSAQTVVSVVTLARSNPGQAAIVGQWDADPFQLGAPNR
jgi:hypothetical protein